MADDKLLILVLTAVVPDAGRRVVAEEAAVRDVSPAARTEVVDPAFEIRIGVVRQTRFTVPEAERVASVSNDVRVQDGDAVRVVHRADRELMIVIASEVVVHGEIGDDHIGGRDVDDRSTPVVGMRSAPIAPKLREFDACLVAVLADQRDVTRGDPQFFVVRTIADEDDPVLNVVVRDSVERLLNRLEVAAAVVRYDDGVDGC